jgi:uncharacterized membrane protein YfcA
MSDAPSIQLAIFLSGTFAAALVTGVAGFAFGIVAAGIWLYALTPTQSSILIVAYAVLVQTYAVWKLRHSLDLYRLGPFIGGSAIGIPAGIAALHWISPAQVRAGVGMLLILYSLYNLAHVKLPELKGASHSADTLIGFLNGILGCITGLGGILPTIWSGLRGWSREQRAVFQPTAVATFLMIMVAFGGAGIITFDTMRLFVLGLPALVVGSWLGWRLYAKLDEAAFRKVILVLVLASGGALLASSEAALVAAWRNGG